MSERFDILRSHSYILGRASAFTPNRTAQKHEVLILTTHDGPARAQTTERSIAFEGGDPVPQIRLSHKSINTC